MTSFSIPLIFPLFPILEGVAAGGEVGTPFFTATSLERLRCVRAFFRSCAKVVFQFSSLNVNVEVEQVEDVP